jgi:hypothetical protein
MRVVVSFREKKASLPSRETPTKRERKNNGNPFFYSPERVKSCREPAPGCSDSTVFFFLFSFLVLMFDGVSVSVVVVDGSWCCC